jgi:hypothetical protein
MADIGKGAGSLLGARRRADENAGALGQLRMQPLRHAARLLLAAFGESACEIRTTHFGLGMPPE